MVRKDQPIQRCALFLNIMESVNTPPLVFTILPATWRDLGALRRLEHECFKEDAWPLPDLVGVLTFPRIIRLKAVVDKQMVGFIAGDAGSPEGIGWITTLGVLAAFRRQGIAKALLESCEAGMGRQCVRLSVRVSNLPAIRLYHRFGYKETGIWPRYYQGGEDALVLEKLRKDGQQNVIDFLVK